MAKEIPSDFNEMQTVKRRFFAMRNGIIADTLRKAGSPFKIIFGLNLPQIVEIAESCPKSAALATRLWNNSSTRESMLIAPMIFPRDEFSLSTALEWIETIPAAEVADILCHRLLRYLDFAPELAETLCLSDKEMTRYTGLRLYFNLVQKHPESALAAAKREISSPAPLTLAIANGLKEEAEFLLG